MEKRPSTASTHSTSDSDHLPDLGTLWMHEKHGLVLLTGIHRLATTGFNEILYMFHVYRLKDDFHTEGIFCVNVWNAQFTPV